ncbi:hypothetical protein HK099_003341 [Clydaea vesicula]|uniref:Uncharacterized protein n=1 Tax=Clydaea vesicula TaxID=447962 RepID=A0AAD5XYU0_9FUNG|nr:hypothetical protein HK099_003341 [Clydaea vesicula]
MKLNYKIILLALSFFLIVSTAKLAKNLEEQAAHWTVKCNSMLELDNMKNNGPRKNQDEMQIITAKEIFIQEINDELYWNGVHAWSVLISAALSLITGIMILIY